MILTLVHAASVWCDLLGHPGPTVADDDRAAIRAGEKAAAYLPAVAKLLADGQSRVVWVLDHGHSWRAEIAPGHDERPSGARAWPRAAWEPMRDALAGPCATCGYRRSLHAPKPDGYAGPGVGSCRAFAPGPTAAVTVEPPCWPARVPSTPMLHYVPLGDDGGELSSGRDLAGLRPAARDVLATAARWWADEHDVGCACETCGEPAIGAYESPEATLGYCATHGGSEAPLRIDASPRLRIISGRRSVLSLVDAAAGIDVIRDVRLGTAGWTLGAPATPELDATVICDALALELCGDWYRDAQTPRAHRSICGRETAERLVLAHGGAMRLAEMVQSVRDGDRLPDSRGAWPVLRWACADDALHLRRALAIEGLRSDVAIDVGALVAQEARSDVRDQGVAGGERGRAIRGADQGLVRDEGGQVLPPGEPREGGRADQGADAGRAAPPREPLTDPQADARPLPRAGAHVDSGASPVTGSGAADGPALAPYCYSQRCNVEHRTDETCAEALKRDVRERLTYLAGEPRDAEHGAGVVVTRADGQQEAAHTPDADKPPARVTCDRCRGGADCAAACRDLGRCAHGGPRCGMGTLSPPTATATSSPRTSPAPKESPMSEQARHDDLHAEPSEYDEPPPAALARRPAAPLAAPAQRQQPAPMVRRERPVTMLCTSDDLDQIAPALIEAQMEFTAVAKTRPADLGARGKYHYANLADIAEAAMPALLKHGIMVTQIPTDGSLVTRLMHRSGQYIQGDLKIVAPDSRGGIQALGSALTYTRRYMLTMMLGIVPADVEDDDGAAAQRNPAASIDDKSPDRRAAAWKALLASMPSARAVEPWRERAEKEAHPKLRADVLTWLDARLVELAPAGAA